MYWWFGLMLACGGEQAPSAPAPELATTAVEVRKAQGTLPLAGELRPWQQVELRARLPAYVRERRVDVGDRVAAKDLLVALSAPDRVAERAGAEAELGAAKAKLARLEVAARGEGVVAALELEEARGAVQSLEAQLRALTQLESELPGSYVDVLWPLDTGAEFAWLPATSLVRNTEGTWVWAVRDGSLVRVEVDEVQREGALVAVRAELGAADRVVTRGSEDLVEGPLPR